MAATAGIVPGAGGGYLMHVAAQRHDAADHHGPLSVKCFLRGEANYRTADGGRYVVRPGSYLILNDGTPYHVTIDAADGITESFCLFFPPGFAGNVMASLVTPADTLLDDPEYRPARPIRFVETVYRHDSLLTPALAALYRMANAPGSLLPGEMDERFHEAACRLLRVHRDVGKRIERLPAIRPATRAEQFRRLARARDFLDATLTDPIGLAESAGVACLAPHHFLRTFKAAYGETPHQYRVRRQMERAAQLLSSTEMTVTHICLTVGWESLGSFSARFKRQFGLSPEAYRKTAIAEKPHLWFFGH